MRFIATFFPDPFAAKSNGKAGQGRKFRNLAQGKSKVRNAGTHSLGRRQIEPCREIEIFADDLSQAMAKANTIRAQNGYGAVRIAKASSGPTPLQVAKAEKEKTARLKAARLTRLKAMTPEQKARHLLRKADVERSRRLGQLMPLVDPPAYDN